MVASCDSQKQHIYPAVDRPEVYARIKCELGDGTGRESGKSHDFIGKQPSFDHSNGKQDKHDGYEHKAYRLAV
jgi:hypothetical protein